MPGLVHKVRSLQTNDSGASPAQVLRPCSFGILLAVIMIVAAGLVLFFFEPGGYRFYPYCFFHRMTGLLCPSCGSLRACHQLLHGHVLAALHLNSLFVISVPLGCLVAGRFFIQSRKGQKKALHPNWLWVALVLGLSFGILRNLPFAHALWLAP
jgi:hypothetical protein